MNPKELLYQLIFNTSYIGNSCSEKSYIPRDTGFYLRRDKLLRKYTKKLNIEFLNKGAANTNYHPTINYLELLDKLTILE